MEWPGMNLGERLVSVARRLAAEHVAQELEALPREPEAINQAEPETTSAEPEFGDEPVSVVLVDLASAVRAKHASRRKSPQAKRAA